MKKSIILIILIIIISLFVCLSMYPHLTYVFDTSFDDVNETWKRYIIDTEITENDSMFKVELDHDPIKVIKENDDIRIEFDGKVCSFTYNHSGRRYYHCNESSNYVIDFNKHYNALVITEFIYDTNENDHEYSGPYILHLAVSNNIRYFDESLWDIIELTEEISHHTIDY